MATPHGIKKQSATSNTTLQHDSAKRRKRELVLAQVRKYGSALRSASKEFKNDKELVTLALSQSGLALQFASDELKKVNDIVTMAVANNGLALRFAAEELKNDKKLVTIAVTQDGNALEYVSAVLKNDKDVVLAAVAQSGAVLWYASDNLKNDKEVAMVAVAQDWEALSFISDELKKDNEVVTAKKRKLNDMSAFAGGGDALRYASDKDKLKTDKEVVMAAEGKKNIVQGGVKHDSVGGFGQPAAATDGFGGGGYGGGFGAAPASLGTKSVQYQPKVIPFGVGAKDAGWSYLSISYMLQFAGKSHEELRMEDLRDDGQQLNTAAHQI